MATNAKAETITAPLAPPEKLPVKPSAVIVNRVNHGNREMIIHVDDSLTLQDLTDRPDLWRGVQRNRDKALSEGDAVQLRWHDQWAFTHVDFADDSEVVFLKPTVHRRRDRDRAPWQNANYEVRAIAGQWTYYRIQDGQRMTTATWPTWEAAKAACIREQAPARS